MAEPASSEWLSITLLVALFILVSLSPRDAWPFARYPMFSRYRKSQEVRVICLALEAKDGSLKWWRPHFYRYTDALGPKLVDLSDASKSFCLREVSRLLALEYGDISWCRSIRILERRWTNGRLSDTALAAIPVEGRLHTTLD
jgi:hypothetical protein